MSVLHAKPRTTRRTPDESPQGIARRRTCGRSMSIPYKLLRSAGYDGESTSRSWRRRCRKMGDSNSCTSLSTCDTRKSRARQPTGTRKFNWRGQQKVRLAKIRPASRRDSRHSKTRTHHLKLEHFPYWAFLPEVNASAHPRRGIERSSFAIFGKDI